MNKLKVTFALLCISINLLAQTEITRTDTVKHVLAEVEIKAFDHNSDIKNIPAAVNYIGTERLNRFNNANIIPALNSTPGVRMEERSPGSYRLSIRGSSLRSPFGVRNVKVYYNDIPFTDPGGHTYLNQLGFYNFQSVEVIKGPGSSLYGAGTGGVMLINSSPADFKQGGKIAFTAGSYGMYNVFGEIRLGNENFQHVVRYQHLQSDGYREHSALKRDILSWDSKAQLGEKDWLTTHFLYGDLHYLTPGALTKKEYDSAPRMARPNTVVVPGAVSANAAINEKTYMAGFTLKHIFSSAFQNTTTLYGAYTMLLNPTFSNYARSSEPHFGGRTSFKYGFKIGRSKFDWLLGGELQQGLASVRVYRTIGGVPDTLQTDDELHLRQYFGFTQLSWQIARFVVTAGLSINRHNVYFTRFSNAPATEFRREYNNEFAPRIAVLFKAGPAISLYGSFSRGFSPPTSTELSPSGGSLNTSLSAEEGLNFEVGTRGMAFNEKFSFDLNAYYFTLRNAIVLRRDASSKDYYLNAGSTKQMGIEAYLNYSLFRTPGTFFQGNIWSSYTLNNSKYDQFIQFDRVQQIETDFSDNKLPSTSPHTLVVGIDLAARLGLYLNLTYYYCDKIALNDANASFADPYHLLGAKLGYKRTVARRYTVNFFVGADNLADQKYSLGNDVNGFGGRYYNLAMGRNYFGGLSVNFDSK